MKQLLGEIHHRPPTGLHVVNGLAQVVSLRGRGDEGIVEHALLIHRGKEHATRQSRRRESVTAHHVCQEAQEHWPQARQLTCQGVKGFALRRFVHVRHGVEDLLIQTIKKGVVTHTQLFEPGLVVADGIQRERKAEDVFPR
ncbi:hypothetical protein D3C78_802600 [compost metagenome]